MHQQLSKEIENDCKAAKGKRSNDNFQEIEELPEAIKIKRNA